LRQRNQQSLAAGLILAAFFIICNCAVYLTLTMDLLSLQRSKREAARSTAAGAVTVVTFVTPTPTSPGIATLAAPAIAPTLAPLWPTVTPGPSPTPASLPPVTLPSPTVPPPEQNPANSPASIRGLGLSSALEILSHQSYIDSLGWHHIVGEVQNKGDVPLEYVEVIARLYDEGEKLISTKITFTAPDVIYPGGKAPFDIITLRKSQWSRLANYELQIKGELAEDLIQQELTLLNQNSYIQDGYLYVTGEVQNTGETPALVKLIVTLYDANLQVVNTDWSYADLGIIRADDISPFEVKVRHRADPENYNYRIQIEEALMTSELVEELEDKTK
jgi:hypothetical protein